MDAPRPPVRAAIAMGSNLGDREGHIAAAVEALSGSPGTRLLAASPVVETAPVGGPAQGPYLNGAAVIETTLSARELLTTLQAIERSRGRTRPDPVRWGPRTLDLDLLLYGDRCTNEPGLTVPHPRMRERLFVLEPLALIAPDWVVPGIGRTVRDLRDALRAGSIMT